jgi:HEAT repeat protein
LVSAGLKAVRNLDSQVAVLGSEDASRSRAAREKLVAAGTEAVPSLIKGLSHEKPRIRSECAVLLGGLGSSAREAYDPLVEVMQRENDPQARAAAATALRQVGTEEALIDTAKRFLHGSDLGLKAEAANMLAHVGPRAQSAIPELLDTLKGGEPYLLAPCCAALGRIGVSSDEVLSVLGGLMLNVEKGLPVQEAALRALGRLGPKAIPHLTRALAEKGLVGIAASIIGSLGRDAKALIPDLLQARDRTRTWEEADATAVMKEDMNNRGVIVREKRNAAGELLERHESRPLGTPGPSTSGVRAEWKNVRRVIDEALEKVGASKEVIENAQASDAKK